MTKQKTKQNKKILMAVQFAAAAATVLVLAGCNTDQSSMQDFFPANEAHATQNLMTAQAAAGARADATLQSMHFDGVKLNSLGEAKLDLMLKDDDSTDSMNVYLNLDSADARYNPRRDAVLSYFEDRGIDKDAVHFENGTNPNVTSLTAEHIERLPRIESTGADDSSSSSSSSSGSSGSSGGSSSQSK